ncbi:MAG: hypothetical protein HYS17_01240 [Micavibrio aeruginosavorus]|uniref:Uncharacterized protein n=1 Tax=Micavibrio aeruginosavorus TaxID=349221 RepID=A0A7T5UHH7_9BACT|nr:MAG: hypothetical protein HYS17_01240 [Micavibrio aeruginosavorus]
MNLHDILRDFITQQFVYQQKWFMSDSSDNVYWGYFEEYVLLGMMEMAEQLTGIGEMQVFSFGAILDAKEQLETQRLIQEKTAQAQRDYHPDMGMCTIGTAAISLAASDRSGETAAVILNKRMIDRQLSLKNSPGHESMTSDVEGRIEQLRRRFCDRHSNTGNTNQICLAAASGPNINKDIDYAGTVGLKRTINMNLVNGAVDSDDENIMALATNLYGGTVFQRTRTPANIELDNEKSWETGIATDFLDKRAITAKRNLAQNSFNAIVGMRSAGSGASANVGNYIHAIFNQLGVGTTAEARQMLGNNPSYYALLEAISQKIYQDPEFYTNLYDAPANVLRKNVAMQAINLMLDRDTFKSELRTEALLSLWLETELARYQSDISNDMNLMTDQELPLP